MNIIKNRLAPIVLALALLIPVASVMANSNHPLKIETGESSTSKITNLVAKIQNNSIAVSGKMKRTKRIGHVFIPGQVQIELFDSKGELFKTVNVNHRKHRHHVNKPYSFSSNIAIESHDVSKVIVTHK